MKELRVFSSIVLGILREYFTNPDLAMVNYLSNFWQLLGTLGNMLQFYSAIETKVMNI